jgi:hypothetical protein
LDIKNKKMPNNKKEILKRVMLAAKQSSDTLDVSQMDRLLTGLCPDRSEHPVLLKNLELYFTRHTTAQKYSFSLNTTGKKYIEGFVAHFASISKIINAKMQQLQQDGHLVSWDAHLMTVSADCGNGHMIYINIDEIENYYYVKVRCPVLADTTKLPFAWNDTFLAAEVLEKSSFLEHLIILYANYAKALAI